MTKRENQVLIYLNLITQHFYVNTLGSDYSIVAITKPVGASVVDRAKGRIQSRLLAVVQDQVTRKPVAVGNDVQIPAVIAVIVSLKDQVM